jgi:EAL domain-containing protein (putative c-di-GMP-specific phosphodiesterase class I)
VTYFPQSEAMDADQLLRQADQAMYQAKLAGKNRHHVFDPDQDRHARGQHESIERIRQALESREFVLFYQPKVNMRSGEVVGAEALIRWQHPERGLLPPALFLPMIEDHPLSIEVGEWVIETALWADAGLAGRGPGHQTQRQRRGAAVAGFLGFRGAAARTAARPPRRRSARLELEILETSALQDVRQVGQVLTACNQLGITCALDDFGTGYSSLSYLKRLPAQVLKIDQSFVRDMLDDPDDLAILEGVLGLAKAFQRKAVAEGCGNRRARRDAAAAGLRAGAGLRHCAPHARGRLARHGPPPGSRMPAGVRQRPCGLMSFRSCMRAWSTVHGWWRWGTSWPASATCRRRWNTSIAALASGWCKSASRHAAGAPHSVRWKRCITRCTSWPRNWWRCKRAIKPPWPCSVCPNCSACATNCWTCWKRSSAGPAAAGQGRPKAMCMCMRIQIRAERHRSRALGDQPRSSPKSRSLSRHCWSTQSPSRRR